MRFCIVGAGAIGGFLAARLALAGEEVTVIARGATLEAIGAQGLRIVHADGREERAPVRATHDPAAVGEVDVVALAVKAHQLPDVVRSAAPLLERAGLVVPMQNGIPFWYFHAHGGGLAGRIVESVDPGGVVSRGIDARRVIGCVVYTAAERTAPGCVAHFAGNRFLLGELDGARSARLQSLCAALEAAQLAAPMLDDVRAEVWLKLWGNLAFNPISALTGATLAGICGDPVGRALACAMMGEAQAVAEAHGIRMRVSLEKRIEASARVGGHKTSMLQDVEARRPLEADAIVGAVVEMGELVGVPTPTIRAIYQAVKLLDRRLQSR